MSDVLPIALGRRAHTAPGQPPVITVDELVGRFLAAQELRHRGGLIGDRLLTAYRHYLGAFRALYGPVAAEAVRPADVTDWILSNDRWRSDYTRQDAARIVQAMFRWAEEEAGVIGRNPVRRVKPCWGKLRPRGAIRPEEYRAIMRLARQCRGLRAGALKAGRRGRPSRNAFRAAMIFLWESGARTCEMRAAAWPDLDWEHGVIALAESKTARATGEVRYIGLTRGALRVLRWLHRRRPPGQPARACIFLNGRGRPWTRGTFGKMFRKYADLAGVRKEVTAYTLRHGFTVAGLMNGVGERQLADQLGHTTTRYVAWYGKDVRKKADYLRGVADQVRRRRPPR